MVRKNITDDKPLAELQSLPPEERALQKRYLSIYIRNQATDGIELLQTSWQATREKFERRVPGLWDVLIDTALNSPVVFDPDFTTITLWSYGMRRAMLGEIALGQPQYHSRGKKKAVAMKTAPETAPLFIFRGPEAGGMREEFHAFDAEQFKTFLIEALGVQWAKLPPMPAPLRVIRSHVERLEP